MPEIPLGETGRSKEKLPDPEDEAFSKKLLECMPKLKKYIQFLLKNEKRNAVTLGEDILQATLAQAIANKHQLEDKDAILTWMETIARNEFLTILRKRRPEISLDDPEGIKTVYALPQLVKNSSRMAKEVEDRVLLAQLEQVATRLLERGHTTAHVGGKGELPSISPDGLAKGIRILQLNILEEMSYKEIGKMFSMEVPAVKSLAHRTRKILEASQI